MVENDVADQIERADSTVTRHPEGCLGFLARLFRTGARSVAGRTAAGGADESPQTQLRYRLRDDFLSRAEGSFFRVLQQVTRDQFLIFPKVNLQDVFYVPHGADEQSARNRISRKHLDFLLCDAKTLRPLVGIELDDRSHDRPDRQERDRFVDQVFATAGLPLLRIPARANYSPTELEVELGVALQLDSTPVNIPASDIAVFGSATPQCPKCGTPMVVRTAKTGANGGRQFYGCPNYPRCRGIVSM